MRFRKNKMGFTIIGRYNNGPGSLPLTTWTPGTEGGASYCWGIRSDGVFLNCVNVANLEKEA